MTKVETNEVMMVIRAFHPRFYANFSDADFIEMIRAWHIMLEEYDRNDVMAAVKAFEAGNTKGFPPESPGQIIDLINRIKNPVEADMTPAEAWAIVSKTMTDLRWESVEESFNALPTTCRKALGSAARLKEMAMEQDAAAQLSDRTRFMDAYKVTAQRERDFAKLPADIRKAIGCYQDQKKDAALSAEPMASHNCITSSRVQTGSNAIEMG